MICIKSDYAIAKNLSKGYTQIHNKFTVKCLNALVDFIFDPLTIDMNFDVQSIKSKSYQTYST